MEQLARVSNMARRCGRTEVGVQKMDANLRHRLRMPSAGGPHSHQ
jgi:hypothetical protein